MWFLNNFKYYEIQKILKIKFLSFIWNFKISGGFKIILINHKRLKNQNLKKLKWK